MPMFANARGAGVLGLPTSAIRLFFYNYSRRNRKFKIGKYHDFMEAYQKAYQMLENNLCTKMAISYGNF